MSWNQLVEWDVDEMMECAANAATPETDLAAAVIKQAIDDVNNYLAGGTRASVEDVQEAVNFLFELTDARGQKWDGLETWVNAAGGDIVRFREIMRELRAHWETFDLMDRLAGGIIGRVNINYHGGPMNAKRWTPEHDAFLRQHYVEYGPVWCGQQLARTPTSVKDRANRVLGLRRICRKHYPKPPLAA